MKKGFLCHCGGLWTFIMTLLPPSYFANDNFMSIWLSNNEFSVKRRVEQNNQRFAESSEEAVLRPQWRQDMKTPSASLDLYDGELSVSSHHKELGWRFSFIVSLNKPWINISRCWWSDMTTSSNGNIFPRYWPFVQGIHRSPVNSPQKGQWRGALMFSLICAWINGWINNLEAGDLKRHRAHYDDIVMRFQDDQCDVTVMWGTYLSPLTTDTWHNDNDIITSKRRHDVVLTQ